MSKSKKFNVALASVAVMVALVGAYFLSVTNVGTARADSVVAYSTTEVLDGTTQYTTTEYTSSYLVAPYAHAQIHASVDVTGTGTVTITPQFSNSILGCGSVTEWFDAVQYVTYTNLETTVILTATATVTTATSVTAGDLTETTLTPQIVLAGDVSGGREFTVLGRCVRFKLTTGGDYYTPTLYMRKLNK